jgi:enoyl-CoA hydratase/carnithine racemase
VPRNGFAGLTSRRRLPKPVIAAVNGFAMGGGCEIALACHLVVADATAKFALSEGKVGLVVGAGGVVRLPRTVPAKVANEMILTGRRVGAEEALAYGLVNRVTEAGAALAGASGVGRRSPRLLADIGADLAAGDAGDPRIPDVVDLRHRNQLTAGLPTRRDVTLQIRSPA